MSDSWVLRRAAASDVEAIRALTREAYAKWVPLIGREPLPMTADYSEAVSNHRIDLIHVDGTFAALIEMIATTDHLLIENVAVAPPFQGRGLGKALVFHAEGVAKASGFSQVRLYTNKLFTANLTLYSKLGYRIDREDPFRGGTVVHMSKALVVEPG